MIPSVQIKLNGRPGVLAGVWMGARCVRLEGEEFNRIVDADDVLEGAGAATPAPGNMTGTARKPIPSSIPESGRWVNAAPCQCGAVPVFTRRSDRMGNGIRRVLYIVYCPHCAAGPRVSASSRRHAVEGWNTGRIK